MALGVIAEQGLTGQMPPVSGVQRLLTCAMLMFLFLSRAERKVRGNGASRGEKIATIVFHSRA